MAETAAEILVLVNAAITAILTGAQSYTIAGRSLTRADLAELREWRSELQTEIAAEAGNTRPYINVGTMRRDD
jgi:hypothetical protein